MAAGTARGRDGAAAVNVFGEVKLYLQAPDEKFTSKDLEAVMELVFTAAEVEAGQWFTLGTMQVHTEEKANETDN